MSHMIPQQITKHPQKRLPAFERQLHGGTVEL